MPTQLDRIEALLEDLLSRLGGTGEASVENEVAMVKARGGDLRKYLKEKGKKQMENEKRRKGK